MKPNSQRFPWIWTEFVTLGFLSCLSLLVRTSYQHEARIDGPFRGDASKYIAVAQNLHIHNVYSTKWSRGAPPEPKLKLTPGYPLFLLPFVAANTRSGQLAFGKVHRDVVQAQAILGTLTVLLVYLLARLWAPQSWAFWPAVLTSLCPHTIALEYFILSETPFIFLLALALLIFSVGWRNGWKFCTLIAGLLFGIAVLFRPIGLLLGPFVGLAYVLRGRDFARNSNRRALLQNGLLILGSLFVLGPYVLWKIDLQKDVAAQTGNAGTGQRRNPLARYLRSGTDIGLAKFRQVKLKRMRVHATTSDIEARTPLSYLLWYLGGKQIYMWKWDNFYNGDVYQYPMKRRAFETHQGLRAVHSVMRYLHWPLYLLTLASPLFLFRIWRLGRAPPEIVTVLAPMLCVAYFLVFLTATLPLPRYAIPARPFSYLLAIFSLKQIQEEIRALFRHRKVALRTNPSPPKENQEK